MQLIQKLELRKLLVPELTQSLKILALPLLDLKGLMDEELAGNPFLEEATSTAAPKPLTRLKSTSQASLSDENWDPAGYLAKAPSLQDVLLRQLGMSAATDEELAIGRELIGNIDDNGYLKADLNQIAAILGLSLESIEKTLKLIQKFEPAGVCARNLQECLLIQAEAAGENDPLLKNIIELHIDDLAHKKYALIAKHLKVPLAEIETRVKKIVRFNPKPGRNYSAEPISKVIPDIIIDEGASNFEITINNEDLPCLRLNKEYAAILKNNNLPIETKDYLKTKLQNAQELLRAVTKRTDTLRKVIEVIAQIQEEAVREGLAELKPLTFQEVADKIGMHESTVCRVVINKYAQLPWGVAALKDFFSGRVTQQDGASISTNSVKNWINELVGAEDKKHPLSDDELAKILSRRNGIKIARRTITKYREEIHILSSSWRREH